MWTVLPCTHRLVVVYVISTTASKGSSTSR